MHNHYNKELKPYAQKLRHDMTKAEVCLWKFVLNAKKMKGYTFNRQRPVLNFIADFMCKELKLVIEIDGLTHQWEGAKEKDDKKDKALAEIGFVVLRFKDEDVLNNITVVSRVTKQAIEDIVQRPITPSHNPLQEGDKQLVRFNNEY